MSNDAIYRSILPILIINSTVIVFFMYYGITWPKRQCSAEVLDRMHSSFLGVFIREFWYWLTDPFVKIFRALGFTPNGITLFSIVLTLVTGYLYAIGEIAWAGWFLIISGTMDMLDGRLARITGTTSRSGAFLDSCTDRYTDAFVFVGITIYFISRNFSPELQIFQVTPFGLFMVFISMLVMIGSAAMSYVKAKGEAMGYTTKRGLMQRPERITMLSVVSALNPFFLIVASRHGLPGDIALVAVMILMAVLINISTLARFLAIYNDIRKDEKITATSSPKS